MQKLFTKSLPLGKLTPMQLLWLKSIGWKISGFDTVSGNKSIEYISPDRWSLCITDHRWKAYESTHDVTFTSENGWQAISKHDQRRVLNR